jgi:hypothetical protein
MECCNQKCRQGRDCPNRMYTDYHLRYLTLFQSIRAWILKITTKK